MTAGGGLEGCPLAGLVAMELAAGSGEMAMGCEFDGGAARPATPAAPTRLTSMRREPDPKRVLQHGYGSGGCLV